MTNHKKKLTAVEAFAQFAIDFNKSILPDEIWHHTKRAVIDWYASLYPGLETQCVQFLEKAIGDDLDRGTSKLGNGRSATAHCLMVLRHMLQKWTIASVKRCITQVQQPLLQRWQLHKL